MSHLSVWLLIGTCFISGAVCLAKAIWDGYLEMKVPGTAPIQASAAKWGAACMIIGTASSPEELEAPLSEKSCVFYSERVERAESIVPTVSNDKVEDAAEELAVTWVHDRTNLVGGFFVSDGSAQVFVLPSEKSMGFFPETESSDDGTGFVEGDERRTEKAVVDGQKIWAAGTPRTLSEMFAYVENDAINVISTDLIAALRKTTPEPLCLFAGDKPLWVCDRAPDTVRSELGTATRNLFFGGVFLLVMGALGVLGRFLNVI